MKLSTDAIFSAGMVLQRDAVNRITGTAPGGAESCYLHLLRKLLLLCTWLLTEILRRTLPLLSALI